MHINFKKFLILSLLFLVINLFSIKAYAYSDHEIDLLAKTIMAEAGSEIMDGKIAVGNVVMNRVKYYGSSIEYILSVSGQFKSSSSPNADCYTAAKKVLNSGVWVVPSNCHYFNNKPPPSGGYSTWSGKQDDYRVYWGKIGNQHFYLMDKNANPGKSETASSGPALYTVEYETPRYGTKPSDEVIEIQQFLLELGYEIEADGYFGKSTDEAVKDIQAKADLEENGIVDDKTLAAIKGEIQKLIDARRKEALKKKNKEIAPYLKKVYSNKLLLESIKDETIKMITRFKFEKSVQELEKITGSKFSDSFVREKNVEIFYAEHFLDVME